MNGIILYQSRYGTTEKYARWLSGETGFPCMPVRKADPKQVQKADVVILGSGIYASGIAGLGYLKKNFRSLRGKKLLVFCVGASPYEEDAFRQLVDHNLKGDLVGIPCFYCRGAFDLDRMTLKDRTLCRMLIRNVEKKDPQDLVPWEQALLSCRDRRGDWADSNYLSPILDAIDQED